MPYHTVRGARLYYERYYEHESETILLIHGHPFDHRMWKEQLGVLKAFDVLLPDLRGYGQSDYAFDKIFIEEGALDLALLMDALEIEKAHLVGLSMGGQIAVEFARLFPHRASSLVLSNTTPAAETNASYEKRLRLAKTILDLGMEAYTRQFIWQYLHPDTIKKETAAYFHLYDMMKNAPVHGAVASLRGRAERRDNFAFLKKITVPSLVIAGEADFFISAAQMKKVAASIPDAQFCVVTGAGHLPNMEQPQQFNALLENFHKAIALSRNGDTGSSSRVAPAV